MEKQINQWNIRCKAGIIDIIIILQQWTKMFLFFGQKIDKSWRKKIVCFYLQIGTKVGDIHRLGW